MESEFVARLSRQLDGLSTGTSRAAAPGSSSSVEKTLICQNAQAAVEAASAELKRYQRLVYYVSVVMAVFLIAALYVLIQFLGGDAPKAAADKVVYALPIAGTVVSGVGMKFILSRRKEAATAVKELTPRFDAKCKGVLAE
jgi:hypothetical protein